LPHKVNDAWLSGKFLGEPHKIFSSLCCIRFFLNRISPGNNFSHKIQELLVSNPTANLQTMGFLPGWEQEPLWK
jgi:abortive infection bacteriophage resistance protein